MIASIEEQQVIGKILAHPRSTAPAPYAAKLPLGARAPPAQARLIKARYDPANLFRSNQNILPESGV